MGSLKMARGSNEPFKRNLISAKIVKKKMILAKIKLRLNGLLDPRAVLSDPMAFDPIYLHKYIHIFIYFIHQVITYFSKHAARAIATLLGTDWLSKHNLNIDWATNTITLNRCPLTCFKENTEPTVPLLAQLLPVCDWDPLTDEYFEIDEAYANRVSCIETHMEKHFDRPLHGPLLVHTTVSTTLAMKKEAL